MERGGEVCEELRKRSIDVSCLQEVKCRRQDARVIGCLEIREGDISCGGLENEMELVLWEEKLCEKVVKVRRVSNGVMAVVLVFEEDG